MPRKDDVEDKRSKPSSGAKVTPLTGKQRRYLRSLAHDQKPVIQIGHSGLTKGVLQAVDAALATHELIKIKLLTECPEDVDVITPKLERATRSSVAQAIGRTLVVYRRRAENPKIALPTGSGAPRPPKAPNRSAEPATARREQPAKPRREQPATPRREQPAARRATSEGSRRAPSPRSKRPSPRDRRR